MSERTMLRKEGGTVVHAAGTDEGHAKVDVQNEPLQVEVADLGTVDVEVTNADPIDVNVANEGPLDANITNEEPIEVEVANAEPIDVSISDERLPLLTAENESTGDPEDLKATSQGQLLVKSEDAYPFYDQYEVHDLGSEQVAAGATEYLAAFAAIGSLSDRVLLLTITGDGTATIGIDVAADLDQSYVPVWYRRETAIATGLVKTSGLSGKVALDLPAGLWIRYVRVWVTETGEANTVTVAAKVGGRP
ncbi:MAG TPA: hypothetical protein VM118_03315 [Acidobacteriota bacterium]|nr:hypothetical protein [Acidobacteriota bacterium]